MMYASQHYKVSCGRIPMAFLDLCRAVLCLQMFGKDSYMKKPKILVVGSMNMDLMIYGLSNLPKWGESSFGTSSEYAVGGKGANQALAAAMQGADTYMAGRIGKDTNGCVILDHLKAAGVHTEYVIQDNKYPTGISTMNMGEEGRYFSINSLGANWQIQTEDIEEILRQNTFDMIVMQLEMPLEVVYRICELGVEKNIPIFLDAGPAMTVPLEKLRGTFVISPNEAEAKALTGIEPDTPENMEKTAKMIYDKAAPKYVLLKLGKRGAYLYDGRSGEWIPGYSVNAIDTTAAGDTFGAAFCVQYSLGREIKEAIRFAHAAAAICVTRKGGQPSIPGQKETERFFRENKR